MRSPFFGVLLTFVILTSAAFAQPAGRISVNVSGLHNDNGVVRCGLYASADTFRQPGREMKGVVARPDGQRATCVFTGVSAGTYAVAVFHAEQSEAQIQYGLFGKPTQGYGFSRNPSSSFGPPSFEAASFSYAGGNQSLPVTLQY